MKTVGLQHNSEATTRRTRLAVAADAAGIAQAHIQAWGEKGTGLGQGLLDAAVGTAPALLRVATRNPRAKAFYAKNGFAPDGTAKTIARWDNVVNERYLR